MIQPQTELLKTEPVSKPETLREKHFEHTVVFGQGPVQEQDGVPKSGREGLNFYSRMLSLSAAQMLKDGITEKVILTGGTTGARAGTPEASTEADLMADIIRRKLTTLSPDGQAYVANGRRIERYENGTPRSKINIDADIKDAFSEKILIENEAKDTLQNFSFIINKYFDSSDVNSEVGLLGIGFHAKDTYNGSGVGRLEVLADIFGINGKVFSAEDIIKELIAEKRGKGTSAREQLLRLANISTHHDVSKMKSVQENLLIEGLQTGGWVDALPFLNNPERVKGMILKSDFVVSEIAKQRGISRDKLEQMESDELLGIIASVKLQGTPKEYGDIKSAIFDVFSSMKDEKGTDYLAKYGKGEIPTSA